MIFILGHDIIQSCVIDLCDHFAQLICDVIHHDLSVYIFYTVFMFLNFPDPAETDQVSKQYSVKFPMFVDCCIRIQALSCEHWGDCIGC